MDLVLQLDDQLMNGQTYTFVFQLTNWLLKPSDATLLQDITNYAPDFMTSVGIEDVVNLGFNFGRGYRNIRFTYEGDGSDVVSDVAQSIAASFKAGSNDNFDFVSATTGSAGITSTEQIDEAANTAKQIGQAAGGAVGGAAGSITKGTLSGVTSGLGAWLVPVALVLAVVLLFQLGGVSNVRRSLQGQ